MNDTQSIDRSEGIRILDPMGGERFAQIKAKGKDLLETALCDTSKTIGEADIMALEVVLWELVFTDPIRTRHEWAVTPGGPMEHTILTGIIAKTAAEAYNEAYSRQIVNPYAVQAAAILHDVARPIMSNGIFYNDKVAHALLKSWGIRENIVAIIPSAELFKTPHVSIADYGDESNPSERESAVARRIIKLADSLAKWNHIGDLQSSQELLTHHDQWAQRYVQSIQARRAANPNTVSRAEEQFLDQTIRDAYCHNDQRMISQVSEWFQSLLLAPNFKAGYSDNETALRGRVKASFNWEDIKSAVIDAYISRLK